jgi:phosphoribosyl-ATP pyrophosphohydrolase/phosphoribosyl-AMP cyclohydrolase
MKTIDGLSYDDRGLVTAVAQDARTGEVLMLAWMNAEAVARTIETGFAHFWSRSRRSLWRKGETSGNELHIEEIRVDCDGDALLLRVIPRGPACHTGETSCFHRRLADSPPAVGAEEDARFGAIGILGELTDVIRERRDVPIDGSYTTRLFAGGIERIAKKVGEEAFETCLAAVSQSDERLAEEAADLLYHLLVLLEARGLSLDVACRALAARRRRSKSS